MKLLTAQSNVSRIDSDRGDSRIVFVAIRRQAFLSAVFSLKLLVFGQVGNTKTTLPEHGLNDIIPHHASRRKGA